MATHRSKLAWQAAKFTGRTTERAAGAAEHAAVGLARWATTDHTGISKMLIAMPGLAEFVADKDLPHIKANKRSWDTDDWTLRNQVLPRSEKLHLDEITQQAVTDFYRGMVHPSAYAQGTANRMLVMFHTLFNLAKKWQIPGAERIRLEA